MRVVIIGGTGHVGSYLVPRLVRLGHEVVNISRGRREPYHPDPAWDGVQHVKLDRAVEEEAGIFGTTVADLEPDVVIDMLCFKPESALQLAVALRGRVRQHLHCGTIWVHGYPVETPVTEDQRREPFGEYGILKNEVETYLLREAQRAGHPVTCLNPGHIVGPGWEPVAPTACHDMETFVRLARGEEVALPNLGLETVHHVHADDVAQAFVQAMSHRSCAVGEAFYVVSRAAVTLRGYAEAVAGWFGKKANLRFLPLEEWKLAQPERYAESALSHVEHCSNFSCAKAERLLEFRPRYSSLQAVREALDWLIEHGQVQV
jgi:nucleoside-diphosphate-sugar epimerase